MSVLPSSAEIIAGLRLPSDQRVDIDWALQELPQHFGQIVGIEIIGIDVPSTVEVARKFAADSGLPFPEGL